MAEVTVFTAARSQQIEDTAVVGGRIEGSNGHLMLIKNNGSETDAGAISFYQATETAAGSVELATSLETQQGVDNQRAVTPAGLASMPGYKYQQTIVFTSSNSFQKSVYLNMRLARVITVGGGGAGGAAGTAAAGAHSSGGGGAGGGYAERWLTPAQMGATETVTVGAGGAGSTSASQGNAGGTSSFGSLVSATGGTGGQVISNQTLYVTAEGGIGGVGTVGDILIAGQSGGPGTGYASLGIGGVGGSSRLGGGATTQATGAGGTGLAGRSGGNYGGGGSGALSNQSAVSSSAGGSGAPGIVIVEIYV